MNEQTPVANCGEVCIFDAGLTSVAEISPPLTQYRHLLSLNLHSNNIRRIEHIAVPSLTSLNLSSNELVTIEGLDSLVNLTVLNLAANQIRDVRGLEALRSLRRLNLSYNKIATLEGCSCLHGEEYSLEVLDIRGNRLRTSQELRYLRGCVHLSEILMSSGRADDQSACWEADYRSRSFELVPSLRILDGLPAESAPHDARAMVAPDDGKVSGLRVMGINPNRPPHPVADVTETPHIDNVLSNRKTAKKRIPAKRTSRTGRERQEPTSNMASVVAVLRDELAHERAAVLQALADKSEALAEKSVLMARVDSARAAQTSLKDECEERVAELKAEIAKVVDECDQLKQTVVSCEELLVAQTAELAGITEEKVAADIKIGDLEEQTSRLKELLLEASGALSTSKGAGEQRAQKEQRLQEEVKSVRGELDSARGELERARGEAEVARASLEATSARLVEKGKEIRCLKEEAAEALQKERSAMAALDTLRKTTEKEMVARDSLLARLREDAERRETAFLAEQRRMEGTLKEAKLDMARVAEANLHKHVQESEAVLADLEQRFLRALAQEKAQSMATKQSLEHCQAERQALIASNESMKELCDYTESLEVEFRNAALHIRAYEEELASVRHEVHLMVKAASSAEDLREAHIKNLEQSLAAQGELLNSMRGDMAHVDVALQAQSSREQEEVRELQEALARAKEKQHTCQMDASRYRGISEERANELQLKQQELLEKMEEVRDFKARNAELAAQLKATQQEMERERTVLQRDLSAVKEACTAMQKDKSEWASSCARLQAQLGEAQYRLKDQDKGIARLREELSTREKALRFVDEEVSQLSSVFRLKEESLASALETIATLEGTLMDLQTEVEAKGEALAQGEESSKEHRQAAQDALARVAEVEAEMRVLLLHMEEEKITSVSRARQLNDIVSQMMKPGHP